MGENANPRSKWLAVRSLADASGYERYAAAQRATSKSVSEGFAEPERLRASRVSRYECGDTNAAIRREGQHQNLCPPEVGSVTSKLKLVVG